MSTGLGEGNPTIGMEGFLLEMMGKATVEGLHRELGKNRVQLHWKGFLSDWKQQDSKMSYCNLFKFIKYMQDQMGLPSGTATRFCTYEVMGAAHNTNVAVP